jgi:hypothetical protein
MYRVCMDGDGSKYCLDLVATPRIMAVVHCDSPTWPRVCLGPFRLCMVIPFTLGVRFPAGAFFLWRSVGAPAGHFVRMVGAPV